MSSVIILDSVTGGMVYGHTVLATIKRRNEAQEVAVIKIPAEAYMEFLRFRYKHVPEVIAYLKAAEETQDCNPEAGKFLRAVDDAIDISQEDAEILERLVKETEAEDDGLAND